MNNAITNYVVYMSACNSELTKQVHFGLAVGTKAFTHDALLFVEYAKTVDTMLLCYLLQYDLGRLETHRPELFGNVIENFIATELTKLISNTGARLGLYHFRTSDQKEVDFVLEKPSGELAAIEVKSRGQVSSDDFKGLNELQRLTGEDFQCGVVLYRGKDIVPFGERLWAIPMDQICS